MRVAALVLPLLLAACGGGGGGAGGDPDADTDSDTDSDNDSDSDSDTDSDTDADTDSDSDSDTDSDTGTETEPECTEYDAAEEEPDDDAPVQTTGAGVPAACSGIAWSRPADYEYLGAFSGTVGYPASHEGVDYVHDDESAAVVPVRAAADGVVAYVRTGCPQSEMFGHNDSLRECGVGWGNHVVVDHGGGVFTRYAHLLLDTILVAVGDDVVRGDDFATMGNSGRSETRHLHFELGLREDAFDPCTWAQSFDAVYDSELLDWE